MATVTKSQTVNAGVFDRFSGVFANMSEKLERRRLYNQTIKELSALSTRDLDDLGIARCNISSIAREAAYGI